MPPVTGTFTKPLSWGEIQNIGRFWGLCLWRLTLRHNQSVTMEMNDTFLALLGPRARESPPATLEEFTAVYVHPDDRIDVASALSACLDRRLGDFTFEHRLLHMPSSQWRWVKTVAMSSEFDNETKTLNIFGATRDIQLFYTALGELKNLREQLHQSREQLTARLKTSDIIVWDWDLTTGEKKYLAPAQDAEAASGKKNWEHFFSENERHSALMEAKKHAQGLTPIYKAEFNIQDEEGRSLTLVETGNVVTRDLSGQGEKLMGILINKAALEAERKHDSYADIFPAANPNRGAFSAFDKWNETMQDEAELKTSRDN